MLRNKKSLSAKLLKDVLDNLKIDDALSSEQEQIEASFFRKILIIAFVGSVITSISQFLSLSKTLDVLLLILDIIILVMVLMCIFAVKRSYKFVMVILFSTGMITIPILEYISYQYSPLLVVEFFIFLEIIIWCGFKKLNGIMGIVYFVMQLAIIIAPMPPEATDPTLLIEYGSSSWTRFFIYIVMIPIAILATATVSNRKNKDLKAERNRLREVNEQLKEAQERIIARNKDIILVAEEERERIAIDLHGDVTNPLRAIIRDLVEKKKSLYQFDQEDFTLLIKDLIAVADVADFNVHNLFASELKQGFFTGLSVLVERSAATKKDLNVVNEISENLKDFEFDLNFTQSVYRILQEAIQNSLKHSQASNLMVSVDVINSDLVAVVKDNGKGFDFDSATAFSKNNHGLYSMFKKASIFDGRIEITSKPNMGTSIKLVVPFPSGQVRKKNQTDEFNIEDILSQLS